ncbi:MAG: carboxypeptidase-like regulatory domain-containing protein, partial [Candidatus Dormibacteraceae bacterium]
MRTSRTQFGPNLWIWLLLVGLVAILGQTASAQTINGAFHGTIVDQSGGVIPGVTVTVKNLANNQVRQAKTNSVGFFTITALPPAGYSVSVTQPGFETITQTDVQLLVNQDLELNFTLRPGAVSQTVNVTAAPPALQTTSATIGQVVGSKQVVNLPLNGRQFTQLVLLT